MVPIRDDIPSRSVAYVTYTLIILNVIVFIYQLTLGESLMAFFQQWALVPAKLSAHFMGKPTDLAVPAWVTLFSSQFLHGGYMHLGGNMLFLWVFGNNVEDEFGKIKYIVFYLGCGAFAALSQWVFSTQSTIPMLGASGAIAGVLGAYIVRFPRAKILTVVPLGFIVTLLKIPAIVFLGLWFVTQAFSSVASLSAQAQIGMEGGGVAYWAHAGGFVCGAALGALLGVFRRR
jgi:membrane associated rhomboid family serine protease